MDESFKNLLTGVLIAMTLLIGLTFLIIKLNTPTIGKVEFTKGDPNLYAGQSEFCKNSVVDLTCAEGLECIIVDETGPYEIGVCLAEGTTPEDPEYKAAYDKYLNNKLKIEKNSFN